VEGGKRYWVIGGVYADSSFERIAGGGAEERIGPFASYEEARAAWQRHAWATVDEANARYRIEEEGADLRYWVIGGPYCDTSFSTPAAGGGEEWHGPFVTYDEAKAEWSRLSWAHVDDAMCRYRIEGMPVEAKPSGRHI